MRDDVRRVGAVVPLADASHVPSRLDQFYRENPDHLKTSFETWETKYGCVVAFGGVKVYYGRCKGCGGLVTARRAEISGFMKGGRWPALCEPCRVANEQKRADNARRRMAALRAKRYADRDEQFRRVGFPAVRQGVRSVMAEPAEDDYLDDYYDED